MKKSVITYIAPVFLVLLTCTQSAENSKSNPLETTFDIPSPATTKTVDILPARIAHAVEDFLLSERLAQAIKGSLPHNFAITPKEDNVVEMAEKFMDIMSYHLVDSDEVYKIVKNLKKNEIRQSRGTAGKMLQ